MKTTPSLLVAALLALSCAQAAAGTTHSFTLPKQAYAGSQERQYKVYVPDGLSGPAPMVMVLHGCQQRETHVLQDWGLTAAADRNRFILVAPFITTYDGARLLNCWGFWMDPHRRQGSGEAEDLRRIGRAVEGSFGIDKRRRFIAGLSSGGAMSVVQAVANNEYWSAAATAAGLPYGEDAASVSLSGCTGSPTFHPLSKVATDMRAQRNHPYAIPLLVLQNEQDCTVRRTAADNLRDAHLAVFGGSDRDTPAKARAGQRPCIVSFQDAYGCSHVFYTANARMDGRTIVETVFYSGPLATPNLQDKDHGHYWIGGEHGRDGEYAVRRGPSHPDIVWDFFNRNPRDADPVDELPPPTAGCTPAVDSPSGHLTAGRAVAGGFFFLSAVANGDRRTIGWMWDSVSRVTLTEGEPGRWYAQAPAGCAP